MERQFEDMNEQYFKGLLGHHDSIVRTHAVCILADIAGENAVGPIGHVLKSTTITPLYDTKPHSR
jgi:hypothetical protein